MIVVSNSSPLFYLYLLGRLDLLQKLYTEIWIPNAVYREMVLQAKDKDRAQAIDNAKWISLTVLKSSSKVIDLCRKTGLDRGEAEAICLAFEKKADIVLIDERDGREYAESQGLYVMGVVGVLLTAKTAKLLPKIKADLDKLRTTNFRMSYQLYEYALTQAGELTP